ncbi:hypothetical protein Leryth_021862 [Lithospermum erythrorhizon]|nr:hypothetical protein Leryth_021862 [Lithospermum erythrorhizon]
MNKALADGGTYGESLPPNTHGDIRRMFQAEQKRDLRNELPLNQCSQISIFLRQTNKLNSNIFLLINPSINSTMST